MERLLSTGPTPSSFYRNKHSNIGLVIHKCSFCSLEKLWVAIQQCGFYFPKKLVYYLEGVSDKRC